MSLFNYINKAKNYIKTYGLIKGIKEIINRKNNKDKALKELNDNSRNYSYHVFAM